jgi:hypothetical protein
MSAEDTAITHNVETLRRDGTLTARFDTAEAGDRAARRAMEAAYNGEQPVPFHELVREEQRKMLHVVRDDDAE